MAFAPLRASLCVLLGALPALADPSPAFLVKDLDTAPVGLPESLGPIRDVGDTVYMPVATNETGLELWKSDGTAAGTAMVKDVAPGGASSFPAVLGSVGGAVLYRAGTQFVHALWRTDGTTAGTELVADIQLGFESVFANGAFYFPADDGVHGRELWKSDGTSAGTVMVADLRPGPDSSDPQHLAALNGAVFFAANDGVHTELWKSDGTSAGTALVEDILPGPQSSSPADLTAFGGLIYFAADGGTGRQLWKSDGTEAGTTAVQDPVPGPIAQSPTDLMNAGGTLYFLVNGTQIWKSDGTSAGTVQVANVPSAYGILFELTVVGDRLYFWNSEDAFVAELWTSDGTSAGTVSLGALALVEDFGENPFGSVFYLTDLGGTLYFAASRALTFPPSNGDVELWKSDGTIAGTVRVKDIQPGTVGSFPIALASVDGELWFSAAGPDGRQLWRSDGSDAGTSPFTAFAWTRNSDPDRLTDLNGTLIFLPYDHPNDGDREPWKSDGTAAGTVRVKDIRAGASSVDEESPFPFATLNGSAFFSANDGASGAELWKSDGTEAGTVRVKDIWPGSTGAEPRELETVNGTVFFRARDSSTGTELWKSNGTSAGTVMVKDLAPGTASSFPRLFTDVNGTLFFSLFQGGGLWKSDGTNAGTVLVSTRVIDSSLEGSAANVNGTLFFSSGGDLWKSDGTTAGTVLVKDYPSGFKLRRITPVGSSMFFLADDDVHGWELWKSDGTTAGTALVRDITPGPADTDFLYSESLAVLGNTVFFATDDLLIGEAVWKSDGTEAGTVILKEAAPVDSFVSSPIAVGAAVVFGAWDEASGEELWATDGTAENTHKVAEIVAGSGASSPHGFAASGSLLFFNAFTNETGRELFAVPIAALMDSDLDGLDYASETANGTDPFDADSDDDDLTDGAELLTHGTDPLDGDSDGDGYGDGTEVAVGTDPLDPQDFPPAVPLVGPWGLGVLAALLLACARPRRRA